MSGHRAIDIADASAAEPEAPEPSWAQVWEELGQRLLSLADLDDPQRPAAFVLRERAAMRASLLIVELERTTDAGWWSARRRRRLRRGLDRALRRCRPETYLEIQELVEVGVHNLRLVYRAFDADPNTSNAGDGSDASAWPWTHAYAALGSFRAVGETGGDATA